MDFKVTVLWVMLYYTIVGINAETGVITHRAFSVITDQRQTDRKTYSFIQWQKSFFGRAWFHIPLTLFDHICKVDWQIKMKICAKALQFEENGFYRGSVVPLMAGCAKMPYTIRFSSLAKAETVSLTTITCSLITYADLETDKIVESPYIYKMSHGGRPNSAVMYVQTDKELNEMYPLHFIKNISFKKLKSNKYLERSNSLEALAETESSDKEDIISAYMILRQTSAPYTKFARFYLSMNLCGRPRPHKLYLCRRCIRKQFHRASMEFDLAGYNENKCKEHDVSVTEQTEDINQQFQPQNRLMLFRCPPILTRYRSTRNFFYTYYVSSNLQNESLTLFVRENQKGKLPRLEANIYELQMEPIVKDIRRQRFLPGPPKIVSQSRRSQKSYREIEDEVNLLEGEIAMPPSVVQYSNKLEIQYLKVKIDETVIQKIYSDKWIPDHVTVSFSKVKSMKMIYQRFVMTYKSIDVCSLLVKQKTLLCNEAFKNEKFSSTPKKEDEAEILPFNEDTKFTCDRNRVKLSAIDADELQTDLFSMWECHGNLQQTQNRFFVGKNHLKNAATIYARVRIGAVDYFYPNALIGGINKYGLVKDEIKMKIQDRTQLTGDEITPATE